jgi:hypothetical protein
VEFYLKAFEAVLPTGEQNLPFACDEAALVMPSVPKYFLVLRSLYLASLLTVTWAHSLLEHSQLINQRTEISATLYM